MAVADVERLKSLIRDVPDWPEPGVVFKDIMPLLANADALREIDRHPRRLGCRA